MEGRRRVNSVPKGVRAGRREQTENFIGWRVTLFVMLLATLIFLPIVLLYTAIAFRALRGTVTASMIQRNSSNFYSECTMWYFTWILGVGFACGCGILNGLWHEQYLQDEKIDAEN